MNKMLNYLQWCPCWYFYLTWICGWKRSLKGWWLMLVAVQACWQDLYWRIRLILADGRWVSCLSVSGVSISDSWIAYALIPANSNGIILGFVVPFPNSSEQLWCCNSSPCRQITLSSASSLPIQFKPRCISRMLPKIE